MIDLMLPLPGLSSVSGKTVVAKFDGGLLSSDGGILVLREVEQRLRVADRLAACIEDPRSRDQVTHRLADITGFRLLMIAAGYEDGNDASNLRGDPMFKMALDLSPSDHELCSQSTISRLETCPTLAPCCAWAAPWSIFIVSPSGRSRGGSRSTSTTRSMRFMAASSYGSSMRITTNMVFSRSSYSTAKAASSRLCFAPPNGRVARRSAPSCAACFGRSGPTGPTPRSCCAATAIIAVPKFSTGVAPMVLITSWASRRPRHYAGISKASRPAPRRALRPVSYTHLRAHET